MANFNQYETKARTWATGHVVAAALIMFAVGLIVGLVL